MLISGPPQREKGIKSKKGFAGMKEDMWHVDFFSLLMWEW